MPIPCAARAPFRRRPARGSATVCFLLALLAAALVPGGPGGDRRFASAAPTQSPTAGVAGGAVLYAAPDGRDADPGTLAAPLRSIQAGIDRLEPGDALVLRGGTYYPAATLAFPRSGAGGRPIAVRAYPGEIPVIDGRAALNPVVEVGRVSEVVLDGLTVRNPGGAWGTAVAVTDGATGVVLTGITAADAPAAAIRIGNTAADVRVLGCDVSHSATGVQVAGRNVVIDGCASHDNDREVNDGADCDGDPNTRGDHGGQAFAFDGTPGPVEVRNSRAWNNRAASVCYGEDGSAFEVYRSQNVAIHDNAVSGDVNTIETAGDTDGVRFWRNEVRSDGIFLTAHQANGMAIANNTIWGMAPSIFVGGGDGFGSGSTAGFVFANNLVVGTGDQLLFVRRSWDATAVVDHNLYWASVAIRRFGFIGGAYYGSFAAWQAGSGGDAHSVWADPGLADPAGGDLLLEPGSPAIDAGMVLPGITDGYAGDAPDIGAREYVGASASGSDNIRLAPSRADFSKRCSSAPGGSVGTAGPAAGAGRTAQVIGAIVAVHTPCGEILKIARVGWSTRMTSLATYGGLSAILFAAAR